ncbi:NXPE family member 4-like [Amphiura filiformis]|uniref:NXPE family member 4-like n=1 Tax=Amphiura filiformis TaxID=82378 RepID=UPI003B2270C6
MYNVAKSLFLLLIGLLMIYFMVATYNPTILDETRLGIQESDLKPFVRISQHDQSDQENPVITIPPHKRMTSSRRSVFHVQNQDDIISGDTVEVLLEAFDVEGNPQTTGGDFWFAVMHNPKFRTSGAIFDNKNGSYSIFFYAAIAGTFNINITLVHPLQALTWLREIYIPDEESFTWDGQFISNDLKLIHKCQVRHIPDDYEFENEQFCYYGHGPDGLGHVAFVCDHPPNKTDCGTLEYLTAHGGEKALDSPVDRLLKGKEYLFKEPNYMSEMSRKRVLVSLGKFGFKMGP